ncbi:MAG: hypothetical protein ACP5E3_19425 [Bacteroidales bacterium]
MIVSWIKKIGFAVSVFRQVWKNKDVIEAEVKEAVERTRNLDADGNGKVSFSEVSVVIAEWVDVVRVTAPSLDFIIQSIKSKVALKEVPGSGEKVIKED